MEKCRFCDLISNHNSANKQNSIPICDTIIYETHNFIVTPALGALVSGYIMIISRNHINSMAYLSENEMDELLKIIGYFKILITEKFKVSPILFEHGSAVNCFSKAANSVDHAHLHIVPVHIKKEIEIIQNAHAFKIPHFETVASFRGKPYFLYVNENNQHYLSHDIILPSQYMRKCIAKEIGNSLEWDWRQFEFTNNVIETVSRLSDVQNVP